MSDWHESLFNSEKGDSLGDGTWGRRKSVDEPALSPVDWDSLEAEAEAKPKRAVRTRLATPAPGSQAESGLLDIKKLAAHMNLEKLEVPAAPKRKPATGEVKAARLATQAKGSTGSGLIDVAELVRQQEAEQARSGQADVEAEAEADVDAKGDAEAEPAPSSSVSGQAAKSLSAALSSPSLVDAPSPAESVVEPLEAPASNRSMMMAMLIVLTLVVVGLAAYVLTKG